MKRPAAKRRLSGFTLVELLVAMVIFAMLAALAYGGYNNSVKQSAIARESMARLEQVQTAMRLLTQDFEQMVPRPVRDALGEGRVAALLAEPEGDSQYAVMLTRAGWSNPAGLPRSTLQRVGYLVIEGKLRRDHWNVLDPTLANQPFQREIIDKVKTLHIRYRGPNQDWQEQWPPLSTSPVLAQRLLPIAVEITLELEDYGEIMRLVEIAR